MKVVCITAGLFKPRPLPLRQGYTVGDLGTWFLGTWYLRVLGHVVLRLLSTCGTRFLGSRWYLALEHVALVTWAHGSYGAWYWALGGTRAFGSFWALGGTWALVGTWLSGNWHLLPFTCGYLVLGTWWYLRRLGT